MGGSTVAVDLASGTCAGAAQIIVGHPFDTIKVKLQTQPRPAPGAPPQYAGAMDATRQVLRNHGFLGLYKGMGAPLVTVAAFNAVLFSTWAGLEGVMRSADGTPPSPAQSFLAGGIAGVPVSLIAAPTELLKCRLQAQAGAKPPPGTPPPSLADLQAGRARYAGPGALASSILRHEGGVAGLYRGLGATLLRELPGNAAYFGVYDLAKQGLAAAQGLEGAGQLGPGSLVLAGGVAGASFWCVSYPADVVKTKLQTDSYFQPKYRGIADCAGKVWAADGWRGLWAGFGPCFARSVPANAVAFLVYEVAHKALSSDGD